MLGQEHAGDGRFEDAARFLEQLFIGRAGQAGAERLVIWSRHASSKSKTAVTAARALAWRALCGGSPSVLLPARVRRHCR